MRLKRANGEAHLRGGCGKPAPPESNSKARRCAAPGGCQPRQVERVVSGEPRDPARPARRADLTSKRPPPPAAELERERNLAAQTPPPPNLRPRRPWPESSPRRSGERTTPPRATELEPGASPAPQPAFRPGDPSPAPGCVEQGTFLFKEPATAPAPQLADRHGQIKVTSQAANGKAEPQRRVSGTTTLDKSIIRSQKAAIQRAPKALSAPAGVRRHLNSARSFGRHERATQVLHRGAR
jgi:hypothetical protein